MVFMTYTVVHHQGAINMGFFSSLLGSSYNVHLYIQSMVKTKLLRSGIIYYPENSHALQPSTQYCKSAYI